MLKRTYNNSLYKKYVDGQNTVSKYKRQHSLKYDYSTVFDNITFDSNIVDIGCRDGQFVKYLHTKGYRNSYGVDIGESGINNAIESYGKDWTQKYLKLQDIQQEFPFEFKCDFINLSHTLEHFVYPEKAMTNIISHLNPGKYIFIAIPSDLPDSGGDMNKLPKGSDYHWTFFRDESAIKQFLAQFGLDILSISRHREHVIGEWRVLCKKKL